MLIAEEDSIDETAVVTHVVGSSATRPPPPPPIFYRRPTSVKSAKVTFQDLARPAERYRSRSLRRHGTDPNMSKGCVPEPLHTSAAAATATTDAIATDAISHH